MTFGREHGEVFLGATVFEIVGGGTISEATYIEAATGETMEITEAADVASFEAAEAAWMRLGVNTHHVVKLPEAGNTLEIRMCH